MSNIDNHQSREEHRSRQEHCETTRVLRAAEFAALALNGRHRRWTEQPSITHALRVARIISELPTEAFMNTSKENNMIAAILHDIIEDAPAVSQLNRIQWQNAIASEFGGDVGMLVDYMTDPPVEVGNRAKRLQMTYDRLKSAWPDAQTLKVADSLDNLPEIVMYDPNFGPRYLKEKAALVPALRNAYAPLLEKLSATILRLNVYLNERKEIPV